MMSPKAVQILVKCADATKGVTLIPSPSETIKDLKVSLLRDSGWSSSSSSSSSLFYLTVDGKPLDDVTRVVESRIGPMSTVVVRPRVLGGGGDGGATGAESRDCYLKMYAERKPDKVDPNEQRLSKWLYCSLSFEPLRHPCVLDPLGNLFNKEPLVHALLAKTLPPAFAHLKGLKDMIPIHLSPIPGSELDRVSDKERARFQCPVSGFEFNGKYKFLALRTCGHVLSAKALKEVKSSACLVCHKEFAETDKIAINGSEEEVHALRERMEQGKAKLRAKKSNKLNNGDLRLSGVKHAVDVDATADKVSCKLDENVGVPITGATDVSVKRLKMSIPVPPNATKEVYSSIFTSSRKKDFKETYSCRSLPLGRN